MPHEIPAAELQPGASIEADFDLWQQRLERLEAEMDGLAGTGQYPAWYDSAPITNIKLQLQSGEADVGYVSRYFDLYSKERELVSAVTGYELDGRPLQQMIEDLGDNLVGRGLAAEVHDGSLHAAILNGIE